MQSSDKHFPETILSLSTPRGGWRRLRGFRLRVLERKFLLYFGDLVLISIALVMALILRTNLVPELAVLLNAFKWFVTLAVLWTIVALMFDIYDLARAASTTHILGSSAFASGTTSVIYLFIPYLTPPLMNRSQGYLFILFAVTLVASWRYVYAGSMAQPAFQRRALVVGAGQSGRALATALQSDYARQDANPYRGTGYILVGFIDDEPVRWGTKVCGLDVFGDSQQLVRLARTLAVDEIIVAITDADTIQPALFEAILDCRELGIPITNMPTIYERLTGRMAVEYASRNIETATGSEENALVRLYFLVKRLVDLVGAIIGLIGVLILTPIVLLVNALTSRGPLLHRQQRVGRGGRSFTVLKFRSMIPNAEEESGAVWAKIEDDRVTPIGRLLRATHLDELPQAANVLRGKMSLVGPRPERPEFVGELSRQIVFYRARHCMRPGITGWAQIHQSYGDSVESAREKLEYDLYYIKHASFFLDSIIILRTITKVLGQRGR